MIRGTIVHTPVCIIGGGTAGIAISSFLRKKMPQNSLRIFEPSPVHYYQPGFSLTGTHYYKDNEIEKKTLKPTKSVLHQSIPIVKEKVLRIDPAKRLIITEENSAFTYDNLIICAGLDLDFNRIRGSFNKLF